MSPARLSSSFNLAWHCLGRQAKERPRKTALILCDGPDAFRSWSYGELDLMVRRFAGGLIASGFHTLAVGFRAFLDTGIVAGTSLGSPGADEVRWLRPVRPGDTLHTIVRILEARPSASKPERGLVRLAFRILNQRGEDVLTFATTMFVRRRAS